MIEHSKWLRETFPVSFDLIGEIMKSGILYLCGRDIMYRPVIILNVRKIINGKFSEESLNAVAAFFFTFVEKKFLIPGRVENWIMIIDLNDVGMMNLPMKRIEAVGKMVQRHYAGRLFRQFVINMGFMLRKSSSLFLNFLDEASQLKINLHNDKTYKRELLKLIAPNNLE